MKQLLLGAALAVTMLASGCQSVRGSFDAQEIISLERGALDRWGQGDPHGYIEIMAPEVTYFDPFQERRVVGLQAMQKLLAPLTGKIRIERYAMIDPAVQRHGDVAILTFNLVNYRKLADGTEQVVNRWNSTETYARIGNRWRIVHSHWSYVTPELRRPSPDGS